MRRKALSAEVSDRGGAQAEIRTGMHEESVCQTNCGIARLSDSARVDPEGWGSSPGSDARFEHQLAILPAEFGSLTLRRLAGLITGAASPAVFASFYRSKHATLAAN